MGSSVQGITKELTLNNPIGEVQTQWANGLKYLTAKYQRLPCEIIHFLLVYWIKMSFIFILGITISLGYFQLHIYIFPAVLTRKINVLLIAWKYTVGKAL